MVLKIVLGVQKGHLRILVKADGPYLYFMKTNFDFVCFPRDFVCFQDSIFGNFGLWAKNQAYAFRPVSKLFFSHFFSNFKSSNRQLSYALSRVKKYAQLSILEPSEIENFKKKVFLKNFFFQKIKNFRQYFSRIYCDFKLV